MFGDILIVDDREVVRRGLRSRFSCRPDWHICVEAADGLEGVEKAEGPVARCRGIRGMREWARFGGHMLIESNHKRTKISFKFPSQNAPSKRVSIIQHNCIVQPIQVTG